MNECENKCVNEHRFKQIEDDLKQLREKNSEDHKEFYNRFEADGKSMVESREDRKHINEKLDKIDVNVESLMQKPAQRYDHVITSIITALVGVLIGFVLSGIIPV